MKALVLADAITGSLALWPVKTESGSLMRNIRPTSIRLTEDELAQIDAAARTAGISRAAYLRRKLLGATESVIRADQKIGDLDSDQREMIRALSRIGNNLNQLARAKNSGDRIDPERIADAISAVTEAVKRVAR